MMTYCFRFLKMEVKDMLWQHVGQDGAVAGDSPTPHPGFNPEEGRTMDIFR